MHERAYLHDQEKLLANMRPSVAHLLVSLLRGLLDALLLAIVLSIIVVLTLWFTTQSYGSIPIYVGIFIVSYAAVALRRYFHWRHASFRVTTDRILLNHHHTLFSHPLHTVKWNQYQESFFGRRTIVDVFFGVRPLCIRYGTADGQMKICFPALRFAEDLKHYLDKVDSAIRGNAISQVQPFVAKPRGQRY